MISNQALKPLTRLKLAEETELIVTRIGMTF